MSNFQQVVELENFLYSGNHQVTRFKHSGGHFYRQDVKKLEAMIASLRGVDLKLYNDRLARQAVVAKVTEASPLKALDTFLGSLLAKLPFTI